VHLVHEPGDLKDRVIAMDAIGDGGMGQDMNAPGGTSQLHHQIVGFRGKEVLCPAADSVEEPMLDDNSAGAAPKCPVLSDQSVVFDKLNFLAELEKLRQWNQSLKKKKAAQNDLWRF